MKPCHNQKPGHNKQVVLRLFDAITANDRERVMSFFNQDSIFHNIPLAPAVGQEEIWEVFRQIHERADAVDWDIHHIAETGSGSVLTERTNRYFVDGRWCEFRVMGVLEVQGCKIAHWRDYFDLQQGLAELGQDSAPMSASASSIQN